MKLKHLLTLALAASLSVAALPAWSAPKPPLPPPFLLPPIPDITHLIPVPKTEVYIAPDVPDGVVFYDGFWWTQRHGGWYRSRDYRREFAPVPPGYVPAPILHLRPDYREHYGHGKRVPYGEWKKRYWRPEWDRERHDEWDHDRGHGDDHHDRGHGDDHRDQGRHEGGGDHGHGDRGPGRD